MKWNKVTEKMPEEDDVCLVACESLNAEGVPVCITYPLSVGWDGKEWTDINGEVVGDVAFWTELPQVTDCKLILEKLHYCLENDACEKADCCYFTTQKEIGALLEYIKELEGRL